MTEQHYRTALHAAEDELAALRGRLAQVVAYIHDPTEPAPARLALARRLGLPEPREDSPSHGH